MSGFDQFWEIVKLVPEIRKSLNVPNAILHIRTVVEALILVIVEVKDHSIYIPIPAEVNR